MRASPTRVLIILFAAVTSTAMAADDPFKDVREEIVQAIERDRIPSLTVAVAREGEVLWQEGFGWANRERRTKADVDTAYSLASISKPITATGLMVLVEQGKIDLDSPANDYLLEAKLAAKIGDPRKATIRRLANHTSGLPLHYQFFYEDEPLQVPPFQESIRRYGVLMNPPGARYQYANFGYGVLDHIIAAQSGVSFADFMRDEVFLPLGMTRTSVGISPEMGSNVAERYARDHSPLPFYDFDHPGASAVYASARDLLRFGMFHLKQPLGTETNRLSGSSLDEMQRPTAKLGDGREYGVGWFINKDENGFRTISHSGGMSGVRTRLTLIPDEGIVVVALCNYSSSMPLDVTHKILSALLPEYAEQRRLRSAHRPNSQPGFPHSPDSLVGYWKGLVSTYEGNKTLELWAQPDGSVHVRLGGGLKTLINGSSLRNDKYTGVFEGDIGTADANRRPYRLHLNTTLRDERIFGALTAISLPARKGGNALSSWVDLQRVSKNPKVRSLFNGENLDGWRVADEFDFARHGPVTVADGEITLGRGIPATGIAWEGSPLRYNYEFTVEAKRVEGSDFFCGITFPVEDKYLSLIVGGWGGGVTGISNLDGMSAVENETTNYEEFQNDRWYQVRLRVTQEKVEAWIDDRQVVDVKTADRRLSIWWEQEPLRPLGIASWQTKAKLRNIRLERIE